MFVMSTLNNTNRFNARGRFFRRAAPQSVRVARNVVHAAFRREHGYTTSGSAHQLSTYRTTKQINLGLRYLVAAGKIITTGSLAAALGLQSADVKVRRVKISMRPNETSSSFFPSTCNVYSGANLTEKQSLQVHENRSLWTTGTIFPPQDDWIPISATGTGTILEFVGSGETEHYVDLEISYRVTIPQQSAVFPAEGEAVSPPVSSFFQEE